MLSFKQFLAESEPQIVTSNGWGLKQPGELIPHSYLHLLNSEETILVSFPHKMIAAYRSDMDSTFVKFLGDYTLLNIKDRSERNTYLSGKFSFNVVHPITGRNMEPYTFHISKRSLATMKIWKPA